MFICNATFMMETHREAEFIKWLSAHKEALAKASSGLSAPENFRLSSMRMAGGIDYRHAEAQSVALQQEFPTRKDAEDWLADTFSTVAADFEAHFAPNAMVFASIFESIPF